jgi:hypothetical protein
MLPITFSDQVGQDMAGVEARLAADFTFVVAEKIESQISLLATRRLGWAYTDFDCIP